MASDPNAGARFRFVPTVREGFRPETPFERDRSSNAIPGPMTVGVELTLAARSKADGAWEQEPKPIADGTLDRPSQEIRMYGPGDVIGVDRTQVTRLEPAPDSNSFPPNCFPLVEFARPDLPWLFSPERADLTGGKSRNRPWVTLVVVRADATGVSVDGGGTNPLPVLSAPTSELPSLTESWAWAHAQVVGDDTAASEVVRRHPERAVSRLVCPRNLAENTKYVAAVVPTFEPGRRVGLGRAPYPDSRGEDDDGEQIAFSWTGEDEDPVELPMYLHWEFHSGEGDFEELANRLSPVRLSDADVGRREVDVRDPGPERIGHHQPVHQTGALKAPGLEVAEFPNRTELVTLLNQPYDLAKRQAGDDDPDLPIVGAPLYGRWHADRDRVDPDSDAWFADVNATLRYRIAAGLGAEVVREKQETYVARAWDQVGELSAMNRKLGRGQLARAASTHIHDRLVGTVGLAGEKNAARLLQFTQPLHRTVATRVGTGLDGPLQSFDAEFRELADLPGSVLTPTFRRLSRPKGPLLRNAEPSLESGDLTASSLAGDFEEKRVTPALLKPELRQRVATLDDLVGDQALPGDDAGGIDVELDRVVRSPVVGGPVGDDDGGGGGIDTGGGPGPGDGFDLSGWEPVVLPRAGAGETQWQFRDGTLDRDVSRRTEGEPTTVPDDGIALAGESRHAPATFPTGVDVVTPELARVARFGAWAQSLPEVDLRRIDLSSVTPATPQAFAVRKVDVQVGSSIDHASTALGQVRALSARLDPANVRVRRSPAPTTVTAYADAVKTNTFTPLFRTLDNLLSTAPEATPDYIGRDRDGFAEGLRTDHEEAVTALSGVVSALEERGLDPARPDLGGEVDPTGPDGDPSAPDLTDLVREVEEAELRMQAVLDRLEQLRTALRLGPAMVQPPRDPGTGVQFGRTYDRSQPEEILDHIDPSITVTESVLSTVTAAGDLSDALSDRDDPIDPVAWAPRFPDPMADALEELSQEYLMPGVSDVPRDSIGALSTDPAFVEAFVAGLNHEFARELLWRRFPTDRRGTYFDTFWDKASNPFSTADDRPDVADLHTWGNPLGQNEHGSGRQGEQFGDEAGRVVLVVRGELLRRFPDTTIYMVRSKSDDDGDRAGRTPKLGQVGHVTEEAVQDQGVEGVEFPIFQGTLDPDVRFLGFDLAPSDAVGDPDADDPGWFFVFEEPMGETRFGLDAGTAEDRGDVPIGVTDPTSSRNGGESLSVDALTADGESPAWNGLSWNHLVGADAGDAGDVDGLVPYVSLWDGPPGAGGDEAKTWRVTRQQVQDWTDGGLVDEYPDLADAYAEWGRNSAHMARITWQRPVRVAIHADDLLSAEVGEQ
ncbi:hypothetical protein [Haloarchaeobius sp. HRN-SO-5]|uniref:hypothetical protein n=1 Tax=Haloarchaeobius sp. HRN-SO-5 TaxID=3446118 RepID=UPI003EBBABB4